MLTVFEKRLPYLLVPLAVGCAIMPVEVLAGSTLSGTDGLNKLVGGNQADHIDGRGGEDTLIGLGGPDTIIGGAGADFICGDGSPKSTATEDITASGDDSIDAGPGFDLAYGGPGDDEINGGPDWDTLFGGPGADTLNGGPDQDKLTGGEGPDGFAGTLEDLHGEVILDMSPEDSVAILDANSAVLRPSLQANGNATMVTVAYGGKSLSFMVNGQFQRAMVRGNTIKLAR